MKDSICEVFGNNIKKYRKLKGLTQEKLANILGIEVKSLSLMETGNCFVSSKTLLKLSETLNIPPARLFEDIDEDDTKYLFNEIVELLEHIKSNPSKLRTLSYVIRGML